MSDGKIRISGSPQFTRRQIIQAVATATLAGPLLSACTKATPSTPAASSGTTAPAAPAVKKQVTLKWQTATLTEAQYEPVWKEMLEKFHKAHPNITVEPVLVARKDHWTKFVTAAKANQAPDVVAVDLAPAAYNGYIVPIDTYFNAEPAQFRNVWSKDTLSGAMWKGKLVGVPTTGGIYAEYYNKELVEKAGLDISKPPKTWEEYLAWAKKLTGPDRWATAILGGKTDTTTRTLLCWIWSNGGEIFNADMTQTTFASNPKTLEALKYYINLDLEHKVVAPGAVNTNYLEQTTLFAQEKIATMRNAYWAYAKVEGDNPKITSKIAVAFPPMQGGNNVTLGTMAADSISKDCKDPEAAWTFIKFMADKEWAIKKAQTAKWISLRTDLSGEPEIMKDPLMAQFFEYGKRTRSYPLPHPLWADMAANDIVMALQTALLKKDTIEGAFQKLDADIAKKIKEM